MPQIFSTLLMEIIVLATIYLSENAFNLFQNINPLPDDKILDWFKLKQLADDILNCI